MSVPAETAIKDEHRLSQEEAFARIRLLRSPNVGPVSYRQLLARFGDARRALDGLPELDRSGKRHYRAAPVAAIEDEIAAAKQAGARYLFHDSPGYPELLAQISGAPPILLYRGDIGLAARPCIAMVGARNASAAAVRLARTFAGELAAGGLTVVSGLARGIDGAAHEGALPATIGVIASGIDIAYPPQHEALQERVATEGLLLAEQPPGTQPRGSHFPVATASSRGWRRERWWSKPHRNPARSSPRGWRARRVAKSWPFPAARWMRGRKGAIC